MLKKTRKFLVLLHRKLKSLIPTHLYSEVVSVCKDILNSLRCRISDLKYVPIEDLVFLLTSIFLCASTLLLFLFFVTLFIFI